MEGAKTLTQARNMPRTHENSRRDHKAPINNIIARRHRSRSSRAVVVRSANDHRDAQTGEPDEGAERRLEEHHEDEAEEEAAAEVRQRVATKLGLFVLIAIVLSRAKRRTVVAFGSERRRVAHGEHGHFL